MLTNKSRLWRLLSLATLIAALALSLSGLTAQASEPDAVVATSLLRVHSGPYLQSDVVGTLTQGTQVALDGRDQAANWLHGKSSDGTTGWLSRAYLAIRTSLDVNSLLVLTDQAAASAGTGTSTTNPRPLKVSGHLTGGFELGGQIQGWNSATVADMQHAGMHWVKRQLNYGDGAGFGWIGEAHNLGFKILLSVVGSPAAVLQNGYFDQYADFVASLAEKGADAIEIWNEANIDRQWPTGHIDAALYTQLLAKSYNAIKSKNTSTMVISGAPSPTGYWGGSDGKSDNGWDDDVFYRGMAEAGAGSYADCIGIHYNEGIVSPLQTSGGWIAYPTNYFDTMLRRALVYFPGKRGCFTELGYLTSQGYGSLPGGFSWAANVTIADQATWLAQAAVRASASGRVRLMVVWNVNMTYFGADPQAGYAIIRNDGSCPACDSLSRVAH